ncbi:formyltetrahydrofolate deformylase [Microbacterium paludicola]|uniref:Formyltetrahydrofolate deformylase n=1 Tax=Microbacterium paludicola TaxID=300019 RepID=A0A4Y9FVQ5_9MICO|nr:formyltetrahydrofolate deformylase [Microbacterium paludicola]MBF0817000.1 formyltetrahydrofolate deformylase [Microbacterium paludicola]TFU32309.1 formyltetrahydrofolate deformylase [Microbacterium paludicola]
MRIDGFTDHACLIVSGPDKEGIVAAVTALLARHGGNIVSLDQHSTDPIGGDFFQRVVFHREGLGESLGELEADLASTLEPLGMTWILRDVSIPKRMAILASIEDHCLLDLLWRHRRGSLPVEIPLVISNHTHTAEDVAAFGVPFVHVPSQKGQDKSESEAQILRHLAEADVDFVVLARYMQILSGDFLQKVGVPVINIHHSFLPAFIGANPYQKAKDRGVKLIGATAHYVTEDLDEGPIIEQDVVRVTHADSTPELRRRGADVERAVLSRAVLWHAQDRVIRSGNHTIVF